MIHSTYSILHLPYLDPDCVDTIPMLGNFGIALLSLGSTADTTHTTQHNTTQNISPSE